MFEIISWQYIDNSIGFNKITSLNMPDMTIWVKINISCTIEHPLFKDVHTFIQNKHKFQHLTALETKILRVIIRVTKETLFVRNPRVNNKFYSWYRVYSVIHHIVECAFRPFLFSERFVVGILRNTKSCCYCLFFKWWLVIDSKKELSGVKRTALI